MSRQARLPNHCAAERTTMLAPIAQITCIVTRICPPTCGMPAGAKVANVETTNHSMPISHRPRVNRRCARSVGVLRHDISPALTPASSTKTGAQKCVIARHEQAEGDIGIRRRILECACQKEVSDVIDGHDDDHQATKQIE